jgi:membrane dipeptidase
MSNIPVILGHHDTLLCLYLPESGCERDFFVRSEIGHLDLPRAQEHGIAGGFFAVYLEPDPSLPAAPTPFGRIPTENGYRVRLADPLEHTYALRTAMEIVALLFRMEDRSQGQLKVVHNVAELDQCIQTGVHAAILHFEGAEAIDPDLNSLEVFYRAGLRSLGPVWSRPTIFGHGVPFGFPLSPDTGPGLTDLGKELVKACNRLGIMIDLSHLNEKGFWDVAALSDAPLVATHSCAHALCPTPRNLTDKQLDAIRDSNGLVGVNFGVGFLREDGDWTAETSLTRIVDHVRYIADRVGVEHVALGSDFDGARVPGDLKDAAGLPKLIGALGEDGFDDAALRLITHENWQRVLRATWKG